MNELDEIKEALNPEEVFLVVDSMTGQDAVNVAESFNEKLDVSGVVLTKLDCDTRDGAALSIRTVADKPIKLIDVGEKLEEIEECHTERIATRTLGMGDVLRFIEKVETKIEENQAKEMKVKMRTTSLTFDDFLEQVGHVTEM